MPEGPETEVVRRTLAPLLVGKKIVSVFASGHELRGRPLQKREVSPLGGREIEAVQRHGKRLALLIGPYRMLIQLGMTGRLVVKPTNLARPKHTHLGLGLGLGLGNSANENGAERAANSVGSNELIYADARRFGSVVLEDVTAPWPPPDLGPDIFDLGSAKTRTQLGMRLLQTKRTLKDALLDQRLLAGAGNIYLCEALFKAGLHPEHRGHLSSEAERERLLVALHAEAKRGLKNGGTSFRDFVDGRGRRGRHQNHLSVFLRADEPCPQCSTLIERLVRGQRSSFFCPRCQPRPTYDEPPGAISARSKRRRRSSSTTR